jgi:alpha-galactosidase
MPTLPPPPRVHKPPRAPLVDAQARRTYSFRVMRKLTIIGAGSAMFTQGLVADAIRNPGGHAWEIALVDVEPGILEAMRRLCTRMVEARGADIRITASTDRRELLPGSHYVVSTIGVGGRRAWEQDVFVPRKYGVFQPVGDSVLPGGISRALRMIPALVAIVRDAVELCPTARILNYANPMTANCLALRRATGVTVVGLCHGTWHTEASLARFAGLDRHEVSSLAVGLNHLTFLYDVRHRGADAWPTVREKLRALRGDPSLAEPFCWELFDTYGAFAAPGDRHVTEFFPERFPGGRYYGKVLGVDAFSFEGTISHGDRIYDDVLALASSSGPLPEDFFSQASGEHEQLMAIIGALETDSRATFSVNLPNRGAVSGLPEDAVLELPAAATARGFLPLRIADFPPALCALLLKHVAIAELTVEAALRGDRRLFVEAILASTCLPDPSRAGAMADEMLAAQRAYLPQFA